MLDSIISDSILSDVAELESYKEIRFSRPIKSNYDLKKMKIFDDEFEDHGRRNKKNVISDDLDESDLTKEDYIQMALHYKTVCKVGFKIKSKNIFYFFFFSLTKNN